MASLSCLICGVILVFLIALIPSTDSTSHYETYTYSYLSPTYQCYTRYYTYCYNWYYWNYWNWGWYWYYPYNYYYGRYYYGYYYWNPWWGYGYWNPCYYQPYSDCYWVYSIRYATGTRCQTGWTGGICDVPVCNTPPCATGLTCINPGICGCASTQASSGQCAIQPCSTTYTCYPGTCSGSTCSCTSPFSGPNCASVSQQPTISGCSVKLYGQKTGGPETVVATATCAAPGLTPLSAWVGATYLDTGIGAVAPFGLTRIEPIWEADYNFPYSFPSQPSFINGVALGVSQASFNVTVGTSSSSDVPCSAVSAVSPLNIAKCDVPTNWGNLGINNYLGSAATTNFTFMVNLKARLGGYKKCDSPSGCTFNGANYQFSSQPFTGTDVVVQAQFTFDLEPPTHCLLGTNRSICTTFGISLDQDIRTNPVINPTFLGWQDYGAGIEKFHVEVYTMTVDPTNDLLEPIGSALIASDVTPQLNNFQFTAPQPGVYSIVLTVYDRANNSAKARKIFNYNDKPSIVTNTSNPARFLEANPAGNYSYIPVLNTPDRLTLDWTGRFQSDSAYGQLFLKRVKDWPVDQNTIDDNFGTRFGMRSVAAVQNLTGIAGISYNYAVDRNGTGGFNFVEPTQDDNSSVQVAISAQSSTLFFDPVLKTGDTVVVWLKAVDVTGNPSRATIRSMVATGRPELADATFIANGIGQYTSGIYINVSDPVTGIAPIQYTITDRGSSIVTGVQSPTVRDYYQATRRKRGLNVPCPKGGDATCYCTPLRQCFNYTQVIVIDNCKLDLYTGAGHNLQVTFTITNGAGVTLQPTTIPLSEVSNVVCRPTPPTAPPPTPPPACNSGCIIGAVIGSIFGLIILLFIILIVIMLIRMQRHQSVPQRFRTVATNVRNRFTMRGRTMDSDNAVYAASEPAPISKSNLRFDRKNNEVDQVYYAANPQTSLISRKQLQITDSTPLGEGRFAVIRRAYLDNNNERQLVAAKALKSGFSSGDSVLMSQKIAFLRDLSKHQNIVCFVGAIEDAGEEGPILLLELCETSLKEWLAALPTVTADNLEDMLNFTLGIARGMEHLHSCKVVHRRLAVRNVLLKRQANGLVAKLIGFGPSAEDSSSGGTDAGGAAAVPIKWMAPETLDTLSSKKPTYNQQTDAWSYGITIWEIYSKGEGPYPDMRSNDVKAQLKRGYRMTCPRNCPPDLFSKVVEPCWNDKANKRPTFKTICRDVEEFRQGTAGQGMYYTDDGTGGDQPTYDSNAMYADGR